MNFGIYCNSNKSGYTNQEISKIGNTLIYLCNEVIGLTKTQALKYLYLLDEFSIKKFGIPFIGLSYEVWQFGPVSQDIFVDLSNERPILLKDYIDINIEFSQQYRYVYLIPKKEFSDDEFTENDMAVLDILVKEYKSHNATKLSDLTHQKNSLWYQAAKENDLLIPFQENRKSSSNCLIDFTKALDDTKSEIYKSYIQNQKINRHYSNA